MIGRGDPSSSGASPTSVSEAIGRWICGAILPTWALLLAFDVDLDGRFGPWPLLPWPQLAVFGLIPLISIVLLTAPRTSSRPMAATLHVAAVVAESVAVYFSGMATALAVAMIFGALLLPLWEALPWIAAAAAPLTSAIALHLLRSERGVDLRRYGLKLGRVVPVRMATWLIIVVLDLGTPSWFGDGSWPWNLRLHFFVAAQVCILRLLFDCTPRNRASRTERAT
jgi:hypothetical protein